MSDGIFLLLNLNHAEYIVIKLFYGNHGWVKKTQFFRKKIAIFSADIDLKSEMRQKGQKLKLNFFRNIKI